jgi:hypothetical protein
MRPHSDEHGNEFVIDDAEAMYLQLIFLFGSDTGSRGSSPYDFAEKTGFSLTFSGVQLANRQSVPEF